MSDNNNTIENTNNNTKNNKSNVENKQEECFFKRHSTFILYYMYNIFIIFDMQIF